LDFSNDAEAVQGNTFLLGSEDLNVNILGRSATGVSISQAVRFVTATNATSATHLSITAHCQSFALLTEFTDDELELRERSLVLQQVLAIPGRERIEQLGIGHGRFVMRRDISTSLSSFRIQ